MKKLNAIFVLLALAAGVYAQGPFTCVSWVQGSLADNVDAAYYDVDFATDAYTKAEATAMKTKADYVIDIAAIDEIELQDIWSRLGDASLVANLSESANAGGDPFDLDANGDGTFGLAFKAFYDAENLYVIFKYVDANNFAVATAGTDNRSMEICFQSKEKDRYEAGYQAALDSTFGKFTRKGTNAQYTRFVELGGGKALFGPDGVSETVSSVGQTGAWGSSIGAANTPETSWNLTQDNTVWAIQAFNFADYLMYLDDEWGATEAANEVAFDPTAIPTISFDVKSNATTIVADADANSQYWWSSNVNDGYTFIYFNGYLNFSEEEWVPVGTEDFLKAAPKSAYIYDNVLKFKGYESPVNVDIFSVVGQKVKSAKNVSTLNVSDLNRGLYIVKVGDDVYKVMK
jgi:hypothetical protein